MNAGDDQRFARMFFGDDSQTGTRRMLAAIVVVCVLFGSLAWWFGR